MKASRASVQGHLRATGLARVPVHALITGAALVVMITTVSAQHEGGWARPGVGLVALVVAAWLPLTLRQLWPVPVLVATVIAESAHLLLSDTLDLDGVVPVPLATALACYTLTQSRDRWLAWTAATAASLTLLIVAAASQPGAALAGGNLWLVNLVVVATAGGSIVRDRRERLLAAEERAASAEHDREAEARRQVTEERLRIARELHDVLGHDLALVNAQASIAHHLLGTDPAAAAKALTGITEHTRAALDELRATVGLLRQDDGPETDPQPPASGASGLADLFSAVSAAGVALTVSTHGSQQPLSVPADLALYRIAQEALTNASKHAPGAHVHVDLRWHDTDVQLTVMNDPRTSRPQSTAGAARGAGMVCSACESGRWLQLAR